MSMNHLAWLGLKRQGSGSMPCSIALAPCCHDSMDNECALLGTDVCCCHRPFQAGSSCQQDLEGSSIVLNQAVVSLLNL